MWRTILRILVYNALICWILFGDQQEVTPRELIWAAVFVVGLNIGAWLFRRRSRPERQIAPGSPTR